MTTQLSQEDKDFLDDFFDKFKNNFSISGEMTLNKIGEYKFRVQQVIKYILAKNLRKHYKKGVIY